MAEGAWPICHTQDGAEGEEMSPPTGPAHPIPIISSTGSTLLAGLSAKGLCPLSTPFASHQPGWAQWDAAASLMIESSQ